MELGLNRETLRSWVRRAEKDKATEAAGGLSAAEREEEKEIPRKATAFSVKEMNR